MSSSPSRTILAATLAALALAGTGHAAVTPARLCATAELKATAKAANTLLACHAQAAQRGGDVAAAGVAKAGSQLVAAFAKAESKGGCLSTGAADVVDGLLDASVSAVVSALRPTTDANRCAAAKLKATGKKSLTKLGCHAQAAKRGGTVEPACLAKIEARFVAAFAKAESKPPCLTSGDAAAVEATVDGLVDDTVTAVGATTNTTVVTTTTTTTLPPSDECPCFTSEQIASLPTNYFDAYGGAVCDVASIRSVATCIVPNAGGPPLQLPRSGFGVFSDFCSAFADLDDDTNGTCNRIPNNVPVTAAQQQACAQALLASPLYRNMCP
jgi:hypothetical protein